MDQVIIWYLVIGLLLTSVSFLKFKIDQLPITTTHLYFLIGAFLGPYGAQVFDFDLIADAKFFEITTEIVVIISLFTAAFKLRLPLKNPLWMAPVRLAFLSMSVTVGLVAAFGVYALNLP